MSERKVIYRAYSGNIQSERLTIIQTATDFELIYQKFKRTNPSQAARKLNIKPKRNLVGEEIFHYPQLDGQDFSQMPFFHLMNKFNPNENPE